MKLTMDRKALLGALKKMATLAGSKTTLPVLGCVLLEARMGEVELTATNLDCWLSLALPCNEVSEPGKVAIPHGMLSRLVSGMTGGEVEMQVDAKHMVKLRAGERRATLAALPADEFPPGPSVTGEELELPPLGRWIRQLLPAASTEAARAVPGLMWVREGSTLTLVTTDGRRLHLVETGVEYGQREGFVLPLEGARLLMELAPDTACRLRVGTVVAFAGEGWEMRARLMEIPIVSFRKVVPTDTRGLIRFPRGEALEALDFAASVLVAKTSSVKLDCAPGKMVLSGSTPEQGTTQAEVEVEKDSPELQVAFNPDYLRAIWRAMDEGHVAMQFTDAFGPAMFREDRFIGVVMPMRVS